MRRAIAPVPACISSTPKASSIEAVERDVALRQDELEHVRVAFGRGRRADHEEPEEGAEAEHQDRGVEREAPPLHAHGGRADRGEDGGEEQRIEAEEEDVADGRERVDAEQPVRRVQQVAGRVDPQRGREESPGAPHRRFPRLPGRDGREQGRADAGREVRVELEDLERVPAAAVREGQEQRDRYIDEQADGERPGPTGDERLAFRPCFSGFVRLATYPGRTLHAQPPASGGFRVDICSLTRSGPNCETGQETGPGE